MPAEIGTPATFVSWLAIRLFSQPALPACVRTCASLAETVAMLAGLP